MRKVKPNDKLYLADYLWYRREGIAEQKPSLKAIGPYCYFTRDYLREACETLRSYQVHPKIMADLAEIWLEQAGSCYPIPEDQWPHSLLKNHRLLPVPMVTTEDTAVHVPNTLIRAIRDSQISIDCTLLALAVTSKMTLYGTTITPTYLANMTEYSNQRYRKHLSTLNRLGILVVDWNQTSVSWSVKWRRFIPVSNPLARFKKRTT